MLYRCIVPGNKKKVSLIDKKTGQIARSITLGIKINLSYCPTNFYWAIAVKMDEDTLSRLSFTKGVIMVETADGKVMILPSDYLTKQGQLKDKQVDRSAMACYHVRKTVLFSFKE